LTLPKAERVKPRKIKVSWSTSFSWQSRPRTAGSRPFPFHAAAGELLCLANC